MQERKDNRGKIPGLLGTDVNTIMGILFLKKKNTKHEVIKISCE